MLHGTLRPGDALNKVRWTRVNKARHWRKTWTRETNRHEGKPCSSSSASRGRTAGVTIGAFVGMSDAAALPTARVIPVAVVAVGWRLLTVPFFDGFAGIEAFNAFMAVVCQGLFFSSTDDSPFSRSGPEDRV